MWLRLNLPMNHWWVGLPPGNNRTIKYLYLELDIFLFQLASDILGMYEIKGVGI